MNDQRGVYWEKEDGQGRVLLLPDGSGQLCIGTEESEGPDVLISSDLPIYLLISRADPDHPNDYYVIEDFDGPLILRPGGYTYDLGGQRIRLL